MMREGVMTDEQAEHEPGRVEMNIKDLIPADWQGHQIWVSSYRAYCVPQNKLLLPPDPFELLNVRCQLFWGGALFWKSRVRMEPRVDGGVLINVEGEGFQQAPDGPFLLLMTPTEYAEATTAEEETRSRLRAVLALLHLALGRNIAVEPLGDLILTSSGDVTAMTPALRNPTYDPPPNLPGERRQLISGLEGAISGLDEHQRNRIELSLQWFFRGEETHQGVDGFLMHWFALESLAMPGSEKIAAIETRLAKIYQFNHASVRESFRLGKLYGLRGDILHHGYHPAIDARVLDLMAAVYWDLLLDTLKLAPFRAAGAILAAHDIDDWFPTWK
jgi:hypothetical protein